MEWLTIEPQTDPRELFEFGVRLHGHRGPFLAAGVRMGLLALRLLGSRGFTGITAEAETGTKPPVSCLVDGLQASTGYISLREEVAQALIDGGACEAMVEWVLTAPEEELFTWEP